jgi:hypothetical protein
LSEDEILAVIKRHPEAIAEALESKPEILTSLIIRLAPWDRFATKEDIKMLIELFNKRFEELKAYSDKRFEAIDKRFEDINKRFEDVNKRFEDLIAYSNKRFEELKTYSDKRFEAIDKRFEDLISYLDKRFEELKSYSDKRFEDMNRRFEDVNKRFEDLRYYVDKRVGLVEKLLIGFNLPILTGIIVMLIKLFMGL